MTPHPLLALAQDRDVRHSSGFRRAAADLSGEVLAAHWSDELRAAPRRAEAGKRFLQPHGGRAPAERQRSKDDEHLAAALVRWCRESGKTLALPEEGSVDFFDWCVPLKSAAADPALGEGDPNRGVERIDLLGATADERLAVGFLRFLEPGAARAGTGDTPLRFLLEALAHAAIAEANRAALASEVEAAHARAWSEAPPVVLLIGSPRYWDALPAARGPEGRSLDPRARAPRARGGARSSASRCASSASPLEGDPGWAYDDAGALLPAAPRLERAWEAGAGRVRPRPRPRPQATEPAPVVVEADLSRPVRAYGPHESYHPGDRIEHPTLGLGVVTRASRGRSRSASARPRAASSRGGRSRRGPLRALDGAGGGPGRRPSRARPAVARAARRHGETARRARRLSSPDGRDG